MRRNIRVNLINSIKNNYDKCFILNSNNFFLLIIKIVHRELKD